jgi:hypothetical protein
MAILSDPRLEQFAHERAKGASGSQAYRSVVGPTARNADANADRWGKKPGVRERIEELKAEASRRCSMSREQFVESLVETLRGKPGEATLDNPLCDSLITRGQRFAVFPPKAQIGAQLAKLCGWDAPTKVEVEAGENLSSFLGKLFIGRQTLGTSNGERSKEASGSAADRR